AGRSREAIPESPTIAEAGLPGFAFYTWAALLAPAGTPAPIVARLNGALREALAQPAIRERLEGLGYGIVGNTPEAFANTLAAEHASMAALIRDAGIRME
ncbi:MAG: tripartite tricarboxylate transporter substrate-binding protein, partial [Pseudomonadota bacterium]